MALDTQSDAPKKTRKKTTTRRRRRRRSEEQAPRARRSLPLPLMIGSAIAAFGLLGAAVWVAVDSDDQPVAVQPAPSTPEEAVTPTPAQAPSAAEPASVDAARMALKVAQRLYDGGQPGAALAVIKEYKATHGKLPYALRILRTELEAVVEAKAKKTPKAKPAPKAEPQIALAAPRRAPLPPIPTVADEEEEEQHDAYGDEDAVDWPDEAESVAERTPEPVRPEPSTPEPASPTAEREEDDEDPFETDDDDEAELEGLGVDTTSPVAMAMNELLVVPHTLRKNHELTVNYPLTESSELEDFESLGFDKFEVCTAYRGAGGYSEGTMGLEVGVSSQRTARMWHAVTLTDSFEIEMELWVNAAGGRSDMTFLLGKKVGVAWGQQIVKVSRSGRTRRVSGTVDRNKFKGERMVKVKITAQDNVLTVRFDGRETAKKKFKPGQLEGRFGLLARGVRFQVTDLKINGFVDASKL